MANSRIVVLDAHTLTPLAPGESSPEHPSWEAISALGELVVHARTVPADIPARCHGAEVVFTNKVPLDAATLGSLPDLKYIGVMATGTNVVDLAAARAAGITVTNVPGYSTMSVAQHVFALLFELVVRTGETSAAVRRGAWETCPDFCFTIAPFHELAGKTMGLVGFGEIGQAVARIADALGMKVLVHSRSEKPSAVPVQWAGLDEVFSRADVVSLHCPLTDGTRHLVNDARLALMKPGALLINTGRGPLVDEPALAGALERGVLAGFGGDVLSTEPPSSGNPLLRAPRVVLTPHIAWASIEARHRLMAILASNLRAFLAGDPVNVVV